MKMEEYVDQISFLLGLPSNENVEGIQLEKAVIIAFRELKRYITSPTMKTVPYQTRTKLSEVGINTKRVLGVQAARPRTGLTLSSIDSGNVFQIAAAVNVYSAVGNTSTINIDPIMSEIAMAQVRNSLATDFQWRYDQPNDALYVAHRDPRPSQMTVKYVPDYQDVSELVDNNYIDYLLRLAVANAKIALGRTRSKYTIQGSNVSLDGEILLDEGNQELQTIREELDSKKNKLVVLN